MNTVKKALATTSVLVALALTSACSNSSVPEGPFITPTVEPTKQADIDVTTPTENPRGGEPTTTEVDPSEITDVDLMPFQYDWRTYKVSAEATERWGEEMATSALPRALEALDVAYHLENVWADGPRTVEDFKAIQDYMLAGSWANLETVVTEKENTGSLMTFMLYKEPNVVVSTVDGKTFTPDSTPPVTTMVENPQMTLVQNPEVFGNNEHRYAFGGTFTHQLFGESESGERLSATYVRDVAVYLLPVGNEWYIDGWYATDMIPVQEGS